VYWPRRPAQLWRYGTSIAKWGKVRFLSPRDFKELGVAKRSRSTTSARSALRQLWSIIARTNFKAATTSMLSNRNCFKLLVKMISATPIARCPSFKFSLSHLGRGIGDRSIRDHHVRRQAAPPQRMNARSDFGFLTILPPVTALAVGLPAQRAIAQRFRAMAQKQTCRLPRRMSVVGGTADMFWKCHHFRVWVESRDVVR
jgi:hypothetical protein